MSKVKITIAEEKYYNNGELLVESIKHKSGKLFSDSIREWLNNEYDLSTKTHTEKGVSWNGYNATELNEALRSKMNIVPDLHGETTVEDGVLMHHGKEGFDFSWFDEEYYIKKLRNVYMGNPGRYEGDKRILELNRYVIKAGGGNYYKRDWNKILSGFTTKAGENIECKKACFTVVGEIQFGNWAIARHDMLRLLNSATTGEIDYYVYIAATGRLEDSLSSGIVSYSGALDLFNENLALLRTPIWVIGIDIG